MQAILKTLGLLLISTVGSVGFFLIFAVAASAEEEAEGIVLVLLPFAFAAELFAYKFFLKNWRDVLINYLIAHCAGFFGGVAALVIMAADGEGEAIALASVVAFCIVAYLGQFLLIYVEKLQAENKALKAEVAEFEGKRKSLTKQMTLLQGKIENQKRWADQQKKGDRLP